MRRIGVLVPAAADDPDFRARLDAFLQALTQLGWITDRNVQIDTRWATTNPAEIRRNAIDLAVLAPDLILADGSLTVSELLQATRAVPIVFPVIGDPVAAGFVETLAKPGGNATGFMNFEFSVGAKWLELLRDIVPDIKRVAVVRDTAASSGAGQLGAVQTLATSLGVEVAPIGVGSADQIKTGLQSLAQFSRRGLIVTASPRAAVYRQPIIELAAQHKIPTTYFERFFVKDGGLLSYGPDIVDQYRRAATYVDRILKGEMPANMPVLAPTKYELVINLKTANALGLTIPPSLLARADEVIE
jgi:putative ABC transport system substrate-binding protein